MLNPKEEGRESYHLYQEGVCYVISCDHCAAREVSARYYRESSRTLYLRGCEHLRGQERDHEDNPLLKHDAVHHQGCKGGYSMKVLWHHKAPLSWQLQKATEIELRRDHIIMNSKGEYNCARFPG